eukprot:TRINITY_DN28720_c0_g1_i2.p1 TRINITY_DN28720_c0_g1~~TRINITY_DN28720_c0_g1_i2.p1  ORF type:complete len:480 (+),score=88.05 TRINITY_DN28720_c0_g1_i2:78-1517(+)
MKSTTAPPLASCSRTTTGANTPNQTFTRDSRTPLSSHSAPFYPHQNEQNSAASGTPAAQMFSPVLLLPVVPMLVSTPPCQPMYESGNLPAASCQPESELQCLGRRTFYSEKLQDDVYQNDAEQELYDEELQDNVYLLGGMRSVAKRLLQASEGLDTISGLDASSGIPSVSRTPSPVHRDLQMESRYSAFPCLRPWQAASSRATCHPSRTPSRSPSPSRDVLPTKSWTPFASTPSTATSVGDSLQKRSSVGSIDDGLQSPELPRRKSHARSKRKARKQESGEPTEAAEKQKQQSTELSIEASEQTSVGAAMPVRYTFIHYTDDADATEAVEPIVMKAHDDIDGVKLRSPPISALAVARAESARSRGAGSSIRCVSAPSRMLSMPTSPEKLKLHLAGNCNPCAYFFSKIDGCRWGDECTYCHVCPAGEIKKRKKQKRVAKKEELRKQREEEGAALELAASTSDDKLRSDEDSACADSVVAL